MYRIFEVFCDNGWVLIVVFVDKVGIFCVNVYICVELFVYDGVIIGFSVCVD